MNPRVNGGQDSEACFRFHELSAEVQGADTSRAATAFIDFNSRDTTLIILRIANCVYDRLVEVAVRRDDSPFVAELGFVVFERVALQIREAAACRDQNGFRAAS